jgi:hypothetical protein
VTDASDKVVVQEWMRTVARRLPGAPPEALAPFAKATAAFDHASSVGTAGGKGGKGASAGGDVSDLGRLLGKGPSEKPLVRVTRTEDGFVIRPGYRKEPSAPRPLGRGEQAWDDDGGLTLSFAGPSVALRRLDVEGTAGGPGERLRPARGRAFYLLAVGETWSVARSVVTVSP